MAVMIDDVATYLQAQGRGTLGTSLFVGYMPDDEDGTYDNAIAVIATGGSTPDEYLPTKCPTFQILIRNRDFATGMTNLDNIRSDLHQKANSTLVANQYYFYYILAISEGGHIGRDEKDRDLFSINFKTLIR